jgi:hypothetical protein
MLHQISPWSGHELDFKTQVVRVGPVTRWTGPTFCSQQGRGRPAKYRSKANVISRYSRQRAERTPPPPRRSRSWQAAGTGVRKLLGVEHAGARFHLLYILRHRGRATRGPPERCGRRSQPDITEARRPYPISSSSSPLCRTLFSRLPSSKPRYCMQFLVAGSDYCPRLMICFLVQ